MLEPDDEDACDEFVSKRYELIYNSYFWKDSLAMVDVAVDPVNNLDHAAGIVLLPQMIDRLAGIRTANNSVRIQGLEHYFRIDWDSFTNNTGQSAFCPAEMAILNPVWLTVRPISNWTAISITDSYNLAFNVLPPDPTILVHNYLQTSNDSSKAYKLVTGADDYGFNPRADKRNGQTDYTIQQGANLNLYGTASSAFTGQLYSANFTANSSIPGTTAIITSDNVADITGAAAIQVKVTWRDSTDRYVVTSTLPLTLTPADGSGFIEIESVFKPVSAGNITVSTSTPISQYFGNTNPFVQVVGTLLPSDLQSPSYQRVRIFPIPATATTLNVLGKKPFTPMTFDTEVPAIRNLDNCLIAFALGDMMQRGRHFAKAKDQYQEGAILLKELALLEALQAAHCSSIEPDTGFGIGAPSPRRNRGYF